MSLKAIVDDYIRRFRSGSEAEREWFREQPRLETALDVAARCVFRDGSRFSHQYRITSRAIERARGKLAANASRIAESKNFARLLQVIGEVLRNVGGLGELYVYDTAFRVGAFLGLAPEAVYLHAGTRVGARALGLDAEQRFLYLSDLPEELRVLAPHEIEDVLCIYADQLAGARAGTFMPPDFTRCRPSPEDESPC